LVQLQTKFLKILFGYRINPRTHNEVTLIGNIQHVSSKEESAQVTTELSRYTYIFFQESFILFRIDPVQHQAWKYDLSHLKEGLSKNKHVSYRICGVHPRHLYFVEANEEPATEIVLHKLDTYLLDDKSGAKKAFFVTYRIKLDHEFEQSTICFHHLRGKCGKRLIYLHHYCFDRDEDEHEVRIYKFNPDDCTVEETEYSYSNLEMFDVFEQNKIAQVSKSLARVIVRTFGNEKEIKEADYLMAKTGSTSFWFAECDGRVYLFDFGL